MMRSTPRQRYEAALDKLVVAERKRDKLQSVRDALMTIIQASRDNVPGLKLTTDGYIGFKLRLGNTESKLARMQSRVDWCTYDYDRTPYAKAPRPRRTVMIDGVRTRLETGS